MFTSISTERVFARTRRSPYRTARSKPCTSIFRRSTDLDSGTRLSSAHTSTCLLRTTRAAFFAYCFSKNSVLGGRTDAKSEDAVTCSVIWPGASPSAMSKYLTPERLPIRCRQIFMASGLGSKIQTSGIDRSSKRDPIHLPWLAPTSITNAGEVLKLMGKIENCDLLMARSLRGEKAASQGWFETGAKTLLAWMIWVIMGGEKASMMRRISGTTL